MKIKKVTLVCSFDNKIMMSHCVPICKMVDFTHRYTGINHFTQYTVKHVACQNSDIVLFMKNNLD